MVFWRFSWWFSAGFPKVFWRFSDGFSDGILKVFLRFSAGFLMAFWRFFGIHTNQGRQLVKFLHDPKVQNNLKLVFLAFSRGMKAFTTPINQNLNVFHVFFKKITSKFRQMGRIAKKRPLYFDFWWKNSIGSDLDPVVSGELTILTQTDLRRGFFEFKRNIF